MYTITILKYIAKLNLTILIWLISGFTALYFRYDGKVLFSIYIRIIPSAFILTVIYFLILLIDQKLFGKTRKTTFEELFSNMRTFLLSGIVYFCFLLVYPDFILPKSFPILTSILALGLYLILHKMISYFLQRLAIKSRAIPVAIYGAGAQAISIIQKITNDKTLDWNPVVILEDDLNSQVNSINGVKIVKGLSIEDLFIKFKPKILIISFSNISNSRLDEIQDLCNNYSIQLKIISPIRAISGEELKISDIRKPTQEELIGKSSLKIDLKSVTQLIQNKSVLITGAGGSIGSELARQISLYNPKKLFLLDRDESCLLETYNSLPNMTPTTIQILADIRDKEWISQIMRESKPQIVFHTAALKHLNMLEKFPEEAYKTNIIGTHNVLSESSKNGVETFINISTDKAADPISVLGKSKLIAERLTSDFASQNSGENCRYISVRFGNVFGSRGSVLQTFIKQIESGGPVKVTDPNATRYFMTIEEAIHLVLKATSSGKNGETLILKMGSPILIDDIAKKLIKASGKEVKVVYTSLNKGEKLHESLIGVNEATTETNEKEIVALKVKPVKIDELTNINRINLL